MRVVLRLNKVFWLTQHPNNGKALLFHRSGIYIVQQTGIKIDKKRDWYENMKIGTIFKNIVYRALCIFQLSGSIFWMLYSTETSIGHEFCIYGVKPRSSGLFTVPNNMPFFIDFDSCLHALYEWYWGWTRCFGSPSTQIMGKHCYSIDLAYISSSRRV